jgi:hypothetical protein
MIPNARYWRLRFTENNGGANLGIFAMDFVNREGGAGLAFDGEAIASHGDAEGIFTGGEPWYVEFVPDSTWVGYAFPYPVSPARVTLTSLGAHAPRSAYVEASHDGDTWYTIPDQITFDIPLE